MAGRGPAQLSGFYLTCRARWVTATVCWLLRAVCGLGAFAPAVPLGFCLACYVFGLGFKGRSQEPLFLNPVGVGHVRVEFGKGFAM